MKRFGSHTLGPNGERLDGRKMASIDLDLRYTPMQRLLMVFWSKSYRQLFDAKSIKSS